MAWQAMAMCLCPFLAVLQRFLFGSITSLTISFSLLITCSSLCFCIFLLVRSVRALTTQLELFSVFIVLTPTKMEMTNKIERIVGKTNGWNTNQTLEEPCKNMKTACKKIYVGAEGASMTLNILILEKSHHRFNE